MLKYLKFGPFLSTLPQKEIEEILPHTTRSSQHNQLKEKQHKKSTFQIYKFGPFEIYIKNQLFLITD